jgi:spore germination protein GerM
MVTVLSLLSLVVLCSLASCSWGGDMAGDAAVIRFKVYFSNDRLMSDATDCLAVFGVDRSVPMTSSIATAALQSLFRGPSSQERAEGYRSFFSETTAGLLKRVRVEAKTAYVDLEDIRQALSGATSSCGSAEFHSQIERTLLQFPAIEQVIYAIKGDPRTFYEWMNEPCSRTNDDCNPAPFRDGR